MQPLYDEQKTVMLNILHHFLFNMQSNLKLQNCDFNGHNEKMKEQNKMPGKGINNLILTSGPWEPEWFETYSQKYLPNGTEYKYFNYEALDADVQMIS